MMGSPTVETLGGFKWEQNFRAESEGYNLGRFASPIAVNGATIVVAARPVSLRNSRSLDINRRHFLRQTSPWHPQQHRIVCVKRNINVSGTTQNSATAIPDGQMTVLSLVLQPDSSYKVYANGTEIMSQAGTGATVNSLNPDHTDTLGSDPDYTHYINVGRGYADAWSTFNGNIGDVYVYKTALSPADRQTLEADIMGRFSTQTYTITSSAGTGGTISPTITVNSGADATFTITPNSGYSVSQVTVDGVNKGAITSYTFTNVTANHTISATFVANPTTYTITPSAGSGGLISPDVPQTVNAGSNKTFVITPNSGYSVSQVLVDGVNIGATTSYTFTNVTANHTIAASFVVTGAITTLIDINATSVAGNNGDAVSSWNNAGTLGGTFGVDGTDQTTRPVIATVRRQTLHPV